jgi:hypothetical protein
MAHGITKGLPTKHNVKNTLLETGKNLIVGVVGGGIAGAAIGKPSLLIGLGITGLGHYFEQELATMFGIGVMAANGFQKQNLQGLSGMDGVKERLEAYKDNFSEKLFIHLIAKKKGKDGTDGLGAVKIFNYKDDLANMRKISDELQQELDNLDHIEKQIESSGLLHMHNNNMNVDELVQQHVDDEEDHSSKDINQNSHEEEFTQQDIII